MKTVRVRIVVAINNDGQWCAHGWPGDDYDSVADCARDGIEPGLCEAVHFVEADIPVPESQVVSGEVA